MIWKRVLRAAATVCAVVAMSSVTSQAFAADAKLELEKGDKIVFIGNTLAERMQYFNGFETLLHSRFPQLNLVVRNLGYSADELTLRPRQRAFDDHGHTLKDEKPQVVFAFFGFNESFGGKDGLAKFNKDLAAFIKETTSTAYDGKQPPKLVLVSPIAQEDLGNSHIIDGKTNNANIQLYTEAMAKAAKDGGVLFADLYHSTAEIEAKDSQQLTINGIHLNEYGDGKVAEVLDNALFGARPATMKADLAKLKAEIAEKNLQFFYDYRAINGCYIYGGRKAPFGVVNFPAEFAKLRKMIENRDNRVWTVAAGGDVPATIDDSNTGDFVRVGSNYKADVPVSSTEATLKTFTLPEGYAINLFASEEQFPDLKKPCQMTFDSKGRLWVTTMASYPQYLPGRPVDDKILVFEDTDGDGKADKQTVFADKLHVPTGLELGDGGLYVAQQPNLMFLKDTDGDGKADVRKLILHGFDSADSHHAMHAFTWDPGGALYFQEGTFHHSQIETPYGPRRVKEAGVFRYEPKTEKFDIFISYGYANPWGHYFDKWGQNFVADASGGANHYGTAYSGQVDYPDKHGRMNEFLVKQWRPTSGCELVSSRNFPEDTQGDYLLNNVIGFHGVLRYKMKEDKSGFKADPVEPLLKSSDTNFRPVDLEFGPDGALYLVDWYNPLIGHMQHSLRDPKRDVEHGRIWRIQYTKKPLVEKAKIADATIPELLNLLKAYEDRTRYRARRELRERDPKAVLAAVDTWLSQLSKTDPEFAHHQLEALWLKQSLDEVDANLLKQVLKSDEPKARAAATRVLCYWRGRVEDTLGLLRKSVNDDNPRVRLEALRALSFFTGKEAEPAQEIAMESLLHDQDYYLEYTLNETNKTIDKRIKAAKSK